MTINYASDLHLEFEENSKFLKSHPIIPTADILVLAGDIGYLGHDTYISHPFWDWASENFKQVLVVPGNHEFYGGYDLSNLRTGMEESIRKNVAWFYNKSITIDDVEFVLSPLWAKIPPLAEYIIQSRVSDFKLIKYNKKLLTPEVFNRLHAESVSFLKSSFENSTTLKRVVVTHHLPSELCMAAEFKGSILNGAFVSNLDDLVLESGVDYWIYGHSHRNMRERIIGNTKLVCNQLGYVSSHENRSFQNYMQLYL